MKVWNCKGSKLISCSLFSNCLSVGFKLSLFFSYPPSAPKSHCTHYYLLCF
ncbi:hypothetical protein RchiOBHm_Chr6g0270011 [Rosa chinensis]|uniref:Uncharacterized protein n=1 Tax=Rosa chinensis TaxID=74649 RepID=A0A2P6PQM7_ROSCH|nr:hypothetical protein RchiOBHm_Chr6g0270011 [Rosa chinensis]